MLIKWGQGKKLSTKELPLKSLSNSFYLEMLWIPTSFTRTWFCRLQIFSDRQKQM